MSICDDWIYSFTATYPFRGIQKDIFQKILKGAIEYDAPGWEHVSVNGKVGLTV